MATSAAALVSGFHFYGGLKYDHYKWPRLQITCDGSTCTMQGRGHERGRGVCFQVEVRIHEPRTPLLFGVVIGEVPASVLADFIEDHRGEWVTSADDGDWQRVLDFLRQWQRDRDSEVKQ